MILPCLGGLISQQHGAFLQTATFFPDFARDVDSTIPIILATDVPQSNPLFLLIRSLRTYPHSEHTKNVCSSRLSVQAPECRTPRRCLPAQLPVTCRREPRLCSIPFHTCRPWVYVVIISPFLITLFHSENIGRDQPAHPRGANPNNQRRPNTLYFPCCILAYSIHFQPSQVFVFVLICVFDIFNLGVFFCYSHNNFSPFDPANCSRE